MRFIINVVLFVWACNLLAADLVTPNTFTAGTPALAAQMNENFQAHANAINGLGVLTPISSLPYTINAAGSYYLTDKLSASGAGISIYADNVTIDLMGFTLQGNGSDNYGIWFNSRSNVTIRNGTVTGFGRAGIYSGNSSGAGNTVEQVRVLGNGTLGNGFDHNGIVIIGANARVSASLVRSNGGGGVRVGEASTVSNNIVSVNGSTGAYAGIYAGARSVISGNEMLGNVVNSGIEAGNYSIVSNNTLSLSNTGFGIYGGTGVLITGNTVTDANVGIYAGTNNTVANNAVSASQGWGIQAGSFNHIAGNTVMTSNNASTVGSGAVTLNNHNQVSNNIVSGSRGLGMNVAGYGNVLRSNNVSSVASLSGSSSCFSLGVTTNALIENAARDCTVRYDGAVASENRNNITW